VEKTLNRVRAVRGAEAYTRAHRSLGAVRHRERPGAVNFWRALSPTEQVAFARAGREQTFSAGTVLMREGQPSDSVVVILDGWTKICIDDNGQERVIAERGPGQLVGESGAEPGGMRRATVVALETVQALVMPTNDFEAFVREYPYVLDIVDKQVYDRQTE
jgi:CRP-like cAMP-binding protein